MSLGWQSWPQRQPFGREGMLHRVATVSSLVRISRCLAPPLSVFLSAALSISLLISILLPGTAFAQSEGEASTSGVNVGVYVSPPFVIAENNTFGGMAIDLWEIVAGKLDLATHYVAYPTFRELVEATRAGDVDAAVTNLTITRNRAELISFTQPWYDAGL